MNNNLLESHYTIELRYLLEDTNFNLFDFPYDFYEPQHRHDFEQKFIDHYYFHEIGCESVQRFKHMLRSKLNLKARYYEQLYETEVKSKGIEFLLNKDLKETFLRENAKSQDATQNGNSKISSVSDSENTLSSTNNANILVSGDYKESSIENGNATLDTDSLTNINKSSNTTNTTNKDNTLQNSTGTNKGESKTENSSHFDENEREQTTLISRGNIGTTSSAELLEKWREVLLNLDEIIINDCRSLFMLIY